MTVIKKNVDISKVGISAERAKMTEAQFTKWAGDHGYVGDLKKAYTSIGGKVKAETK